MRLRTDNAGFVIFIRIAVLAIGAISLAYGLSTVESCLGNALIYIGVGFAVLLPAAMGTISFQGIMISGGIGFILILVGTFIGC